MNRAQQVLAHVVREVEDTGFRAHGVDVRVARDVAVTF